MSVPSPTFFFFFLIGGKKASASICGLAQCWKMPAVAHQSLAGTNRQQLVEMHHYHFDKVRALVFSPPPFLGGPNAVSVLDNLCFDQMILILTSSQNNHNEASQLKSSG